MASTSFYLLAPVSLFVIIGPITLVPLFLAITRTNSPDERVRMAKVACSIASLVLLSFALFGEMVFNILGITMPAFQVAGGAILFLIGLDMLKAQTSPQKITGDETEVAARKEDIAVTPLAVPLLAGPGAISTTVLLNAQAEHWGHRSFLILSILAILLLTFGFLKAASHGGRLINPLVMRVVQRLMGLILAALAVQFVLNGLQAIGAIA